MVLATIAYQRSGTKFFSSLLSSSGLIHSRGEVFNPSAGNHKTFRNYLCTKDTDAVFSSDSYELVHDFILTLPGEATHIHFDIMFNQIEHACVAWNRHSHPFIYSYLKIIRAVPILLTRDSKEIFISNKVIHKLPVSHFRRGAPINIPKQGKLTLSNSEFAIFEKELQFHYALVREFFKDYEWFIEIDYSELSDNYVPDRVFEALSRKAKVDNEFFNWNPSVQLHSNFIKNPTVYEVEWID